MGSTQKVSEVEAITKELKRLNKNLGWQVTLFRGIVGGFGTAIGAGLLVTVVAVVFEQLTGLPLLGPLFSFIGNFLGLK